MERYEAKRRGRIAATVALVTLMCVLCALMVALTRGQGRVAFNTARLVWVGEAERAWR